METLFRKVSVKERLPESYGQYFTNVGWQDYISENKLEFAGTEWWLEEVSQPKGHAVILEEGIGNEFEQYAQLSESIRRMASTGTTGTVMEWGDFLRELNNALRSSQPPLSSELPSDEEFINKCADMGYYSMEDKAFCRALRIWLTEKMKQNG